MPPPASAPATAASTPSRPQSANPPTIDTPSRTSVTNTSAVLGGTVESNGGATITKTGVVYALTSDANPQINGGTVPSKSTRQPRQSGAFTVSATQPDRRHKPTLRSLRDQQLWHDLHHATSFTTLAAADREHADVRGGHQHLRDARRQRRVQRRRRPSPRRGVVLRSYVRQAANPLTAGTDVDTAARHHSGAFTVPATGLSASTSYTFEAFATNSLGTTYTPQPASRRPPRASSPRGPSPPPPAPPTTARRRPTAPARRPRSA